MFNVSNYKPKMATCTSLEPNYNFLSIMTSRASSKKLEEDPDGYAVKDEKDALNISANKEFQVPDSSFV